MEIATPTTIVTTATVTATAVGTITWEEVVAQEDPVTWAIRCTTVRVAATAAAAVVVAVLVLRPIWEVITIRR